MREVENFRHKFNVHLYDYDFQSLYGLATSSPLEPDRNRTCLLDRPSDRSHLVPVGKFCLIHRNIQRRLFLMVVLNEWGKLAPGRLEARTNRTCAGEHNLFPRICRRSIVKVEDNVAPRTLKANIQF